MKAKDCMISCDPLYLAAYPDRRRMWPDHIEFFPVIDESGRYIGILSGDLLRSGLLADRQAVLAQMKPPFPAVMGESAVDALTVPHVVCDREGRPVGIITAQQIIRIHLRSKEKSGQNAFEKFVESFGNGISVTNQDGTIVYVNTMYEKLTALKEADLSGKNMIHLVQEHYFDQSVSAQVLEQRKSVTINQHINGRQFMVTGYPFWDEEEKIEKIVNIIEPLDDIEDFPGQCACIPAGSTGQVVFASKAMAKLMKVIKKLAPYDSNVLITGESGVGKEVIARFIHHTSTRKDGPFLGINCSAIPDSLLESEIFGYDRGAFSGAIKEGKPGLLELADNGTFFLDEIGDMPLHLQAKLLRFLETREIRRIGGQKSIPVSCRILAATNQCLEHAVQEHRFREDLYYRLFVIPVHIPPLRERPEDIPGLLTYYLQYYNRKFNCEKVIDRRVTAILQQYEWKGNIRELKNLIERMVILSDGNIITMKDIPAYICAARRFSRQTTDHVRQVMARTEEQLLAELYEELGSWNDVAHELGISRATVYRKVKKYGL